MTKTKTKTNTTKQYTKLKMGLTNKQRGDMKGIVGANNGSLWHGASPVASLAGCVILA